MHEPWRVDLLGQLSLRRGDRVVTRFRSPKVGLLLAYLSYFGERMHRRDDLVEMLWPEASPHAARNRLSQVVVWLRPLLEPEDASDIAPNTVLLSDRTGLQLAPEAISLDVAEFEAALASASRAGASRDERIQALTQARDLYGGDLLPGFYNDWVLNERRRLSESRIGALETLARLHRERAQDGDLTAAETFAREAVAADPTREEAHQELMRVLATAGQSAAALRQFHELEQILAQELDEKPSAETLAVVEQIRKQPVSVAPVESRRAWESEPAVSLQDTAESPGWAALPVPLTRFFGRQTEIAQATQMVQEGTRLITLLGTGGCGKTRLAIEIGRRFLPTFEGAVAFVPLADISDPALIPTEIAEALRRKRVGENPLEQIVAALAQSPKALLILDNLEHLVQGAVGLLRGLLEKLPTLTILVTSRQRMGVEGEAALHVLPLPLPEGKEVGLEALSAAPSVRLFADRAQAVRPSFRLTPANAATVAALCERLEGIPLAIELCAAWSEILTPAQMLAQVEDRFALLVSRRSDLPDRHRTLRAAIEYSFALLPPDLKAAFVHLSVFRGGWTLEAAAAVLGADPLPVAAVKDIWKGEIPEILIRLRERSLIVAEESPVDDAMRYRMLETLREFAEAERTGEAGDATVAERHADYFLHLVEISRTKLTGPEASVWLARLEAEHDNLRATLQWYRETRTVGKGLRLAAILLGFWDIRGYFAEGVEWLTQFLALSEPERETYAADRARALFAQARLAHSLGEFEEAYSAATRSLEEARSAGDARQGIVTLYFIGVLAGRMERFAEARQAHTESLAEARRLGETNSVGSNLTDLGSLATREGQFEEARIYLEESRTLFRDAGMITNEAAALNNLGLVARYQGDYALARTLLHQAREMHQASGFRVGYITALINLGTVSRIQEEYAESRSYLSEALRIAWEVRSKYVVAWAIKEFGNLAVAEGQFALGTRLLGAADALREALRVSFSPADPEELTRDQGLARAALGDAAFDAAWSGGRVAPLERIIEEALASPGS